MSNVILNNPVNLSTPAAEPVSVIIPVRNEQTSIESLLRGLLAQTFPPTEIVIVDGGSTDATKDIVRQMQLTSPVPIVLVETVQAFPGRGRNLAIARASHEWLASIDAGIRPQGDWLEHLMRTAAREPDAEVIYGTAEPITDTYFTECAAIAYLPPGPMTQILPSSLMRRTAWASAGGFREDLRSGEDLLFFRSLADQQVRTVNCPEAVVRWELRPDLSGTFHRFVAYSFNGMKAGLAGHWQYSVTRLYLVMLLLVVLGFWFWPLWLLPPLILLLRTERRIRGWFRFHKPERTWIEMLNPRRILTVGWINVVIDVAAFIGMGRWFLARRAGSAEH